VTVTTQIVPLRIVFDDGTVADPTEASSCADGRVGVDDFVQSPLFVDNDYGDGHPRQYVESFRYREFWSQTGAPHALNPLYSVRLAPVVLPTVTIEVHGASTRARVCPTPGATARLGIIDIDQLDEKLFDEIIPALKPYGVAPNTLPLFLLRGVLMGEASDSNAIIGGYHNAAFAEADRADPGSEDKSRAAKSTAPTPIQTWSVANYDDFHFFLFDEDIAVGAHEIAEWLDDPYVNNVAPSWGHTGQVGDCVDILEVGDPLSGTLTTVDGANGVTYHPQELAFFSWFYEQSPSFGYNGLYSSNGTLDGPAQYCQ